MRKLLLILVLFLTAFFVRIYHIADHTEFLGDQGRDALVIHQFIAENKWPTVGPTVGAGNYTGPFYYYFIAPSFIFFGPSPIPAAVQMVCVSVTAIALFMYLTTSLFNFPIAYGTSMLWALSPLMVIQDRRLWNPTPIPFFVMVLFVSLLWISKQKYWACVMTGFASAALIQLHYVNAITLFFSTILLGGIVYKTKKTGENRNIFFWSIAGACTCIILLFPFLLYEIKRGFVDVVGSFMMLPIREEVFSKRMYVNSCIDIFTKLISYIVAFPSKLSLLFVGFLLIIGNIIRREYISYILVAWVFFGIACLAFNREVFQPQYTYQFIPIVFLLFANALFFVRHRMILSLLVVFIGIGGTIFSWSVIQPYTIDSADIPRIEKLTDAVIAKAEGKPFSFTIINSRSYTDFHMRYYLMLKKANIVSIDENISAPLYVLCEERCIEETVKKSFPVMCHTDYCPIDLPTIDKKVWKYVSTQYVGTSAIYTYMR